MPGTRLGAWWPPSVPPFANIIPLGRNPRRRVLSSYLHRHGAETYRREKPSPAGRFRRGEHLSEGEIVAIVITIVTCIIEIIINIILTTNTISISTSSHLISLLQLFRTIHPLYFTGVDYSFVVNAIKFWWMIIVMTRLLTTNLSPLIMISFMSCE